MKESYYFSHDYNARNDPKLIKLTMLGLDYVGLYWGIIEMLHEQGGYLSIDPDILAFNLRTDNQHITTLINFPELFIIENNKFTCKRVLENLKKREIIKEKTRNSALKRWSGNANAMRTQCEGNAIKERKGKEKKVNTLASTEADFFASLKNNLAYKHINIEIELAKMDAWLLSHPGRQKTKRFIINWLNKIEVPMGIKQPQWVKPY